jgi:hypothetical protein
MTNKAVLDPRVIIGRLALMTIDLVLDYCLEDIQIKATAAIDGESNTGSTLPELSRTTACSTNTNSKRLGRR